ncbi:MAG: transketolase family protein [Methanomassiliicoccales archaeon]|nr:MAG: transketolase family protein [Methanomassiliicoccales archaeon]
MIAQRKEYGRALVDLGKIREDVVVLDSDLSGSTRTSKFAKAFPERFFNCGIAEQNMIGTAAGLASAGKTVFASSFAVFATGRCLDQIRQSIAYPKLNVKIVATHAGISVGPDGASHQTMEDIALMRTIPNMTVVVPADAPETYRAVMAVADFKGPCYVRMGRSEVPVVTEGSTEFRIGKVQTVRDGNDVTLIGTGQMLAACLDAADMLAKEGVSPRVLNLSTIKPLDGEMLIKAAKETGAIVVAEEHNKLTGAGSAVATYLADKISVPVHIVGMDDMFGESGESEELMMKYGLTAESVVQAAKEAIRRRDR